MGLHFTILMDLNLILIAVIAEKILAKPNRAEGFMIRHKPSGKFLTSGLHDLGNCGKIWRTAGHLNGAITYHVRSRRYPPDLVTNAQDYEVVVLEEIERITLIQWIGKSNDQT